jgi:hypothetical protein
MWFPLSTYLCSVRLLARLFRDPGRMVAQGVVDLMTQPENSGYFAFSLVLGTRLYDEGGSQYVNGRYGYSRVWTVNAKQISL